MYSDPRRFQNRSSGERQKFSPGHLVEAIKTVISFFTRHKYPQERLRKARFFPFKALLLVHDLLAVNLAFGVGLFLTGTGFYLVADFREFFSIFIFSIIFMFFFYGQNLYNYNTIYLSKSHLSKMFQSFGWGVLSVILVSILYTSHYTFLGESIIVLIFISTAIGLILLERFSSIRPFNIFKALGINILAIAILAFAIMEKRPPILILENRMTVFISSLLLLVLVLGGRYLLVQKVFKTRMRRRLRPQVVIVGLDNQTENMIDRIIERNVPFWVAGFVSEEDVSQLNGIVPKKRLGDIKDLPAIIGKHHIDEIIITKHVDQSDIIPILSHQCSTPLHAWFPIGMSPMTQMKLREHFICGIPMVKSRIHNKRYKYDHIAYGLDCLITLPLFLLMLPLFVLIAAAIKLGSDGPVFYKAKMVGENGRIFGMHKFRSMRVETTCEPHKDFITKFIKEKPCQQGVNKKVFKLTEDVRITWVGRFIRKWSLDELPQLINVLKGDMRLIGPRPCLPYEYELYQDWHKKRTCIRPGITGLWQVAGRSRVTFDEMVIMDLYYIYNKGLLIDLKILYETLFAVVGKKGAY
jgi:exopolysaccharide biosynthesis polyprenyl glycosylphosphotransferase